MTPATSFVSKPSSFPTPWSSWTMKSPVRRSAKEARARPRRRSARGGRLRKTCVSASRTRAKLPPDEAAAGGRHGEEKLRLLGQVVAGRDDPRVGAPEEVLGPERLARVRERDDDAVAAVDEPAQLRLGLGETARRDRRPLRLERERLRLREGVELGRPCERDLLETFLGPHPPHLVRLPREVGRAVEHGDEVVRDLRRRRRLVVGERRLGELVPSLGRRVDDGSLDGMERALREGREGAHLLDLVAVEVDSERLAAGGREDVDQPAADRELAAFLGALHALVSGERELLGEPVEAGLGAGLEPDRLRAALPAAASLRPARSPTRTRALRRRARPGRAPARRRGAAAARARSPSARRDRGAERPARSRRTSRPPRRRHVRPRPPAAGRRAARELLVQRREQQRQDRLGDAGAARQGGRERLQALEREQLPDERVQHGTVHDERRERAPAPLQSTMRRWASDRESR